MAEIRSLNPVSVWKPVHLLLFIISDHGLYLGKFTIDMEQKRDCQLLETMANAEGNQGVAMKMMEDKDMVPDNISCIKINIKLEPSELMEHCSTCG